MVEMNSDKHNRQRFSLTLPPHRGGFSTQSCIYRIKGCMVTDRTLNTLYLFGLIWMKELPTISTHTCTHTHTNHPASYIPPKTQSIPIPPQTAPTPESSSETLTLCPAFIFKSRTLKKRKKKRKEKKTFCFWQSRTENLSGVNSGKHVICNKHVLYPMRLSCARTGHGKYVHLSDVQLMCSFIHSVSHSFRLQ